LGIVELVADRIQQLSGEVSIMDERDAVDRVIQDLYAGALESSAWNRAMIGMSDLLGCSGAILIAANPATQSITRDEVYADASEIMQLYRQHWADKDIRITRGLAFPAGEPHSERQFVAKREWQRSAILNEFLLPLDVPYILATWLHKSAHKVVALTFEGSKRRGPFAEHDAHRLRRLIPHVQRALDMRDRLEAHDVRANALISVTEQSHIGVIVLDSKCRILEATGLAESLLKAGVGMRRAADRTLWLRGSAGARLRLWVAAGSPPEDIATGFLSVPRDCGRQPLTLVVTPMPVVPVPWTGPDPRWIVCVFDPETHLLPAAAVISRDLRISAREAEIAVLLSTGRDLFSMAEELGISVHTIRVHLKHIFEKTGAHSQSGLVRLVLLSPAMHFGGNH
jgi:DNA-binding CsgD family transcriptional regulator